MDIPAVNHCMFPPSYTASAGAPAVGYRMHSGPQKTVRPACTITLRSRGEDQILPIQQILYAEIFDHELHVHTLDGKTYCGRGHLSALEEQLSGCAFLRCHRSYLVHLPYVTNLCRYQITLSGGAVLPVSKQNYLVIQRELSSYLLQLKTACPLP